MESGSFRAAPRICGVRCAWLNGSKLKQSAPIDEAEVQDNVTGQVPVRS